MDRKSFCCFWLPFGVRSGDFCPRGPIPEDKRPRLNNLLFFSFTDLDLGVQFKSDLSKLPGKRLPILLLTLNL